MARTKGAVDKTPRKNSKTARESGNGGAHAPTARRTRLATGQQRAESAARGDNGINDDLVEQCATEIFEQDDVLATFRAEYMNRCKGPRQAQKDIMERAREGGVPVRAFKIDLQRRRLENRANELREKAEPDDQQLIDMIRRILNEKLGPYVDLPLGRAAMDDSERRARAIGSLTGGMDD